MSGTKLTSLIEKTTPIVDQDMFYMADYNGGSYASKKLSALSLERFIIDNSKYDTEVFALPYQRSATAWTGNPSTYFPNICLSDIVANRDITLAQFPTLVPILRSIKMGLRVGHPDQALYMRVSNWAISGGTATLTFFGGSDEIAFIAALAEDRQVPGTSSNWRCVTLATAIGSIAAGEYAIANVNAAAGTISFSSTGSTGSGAVSATVEFYAYRIPNSTGARLYGLQGMTLHSANDINAYFIGGMMRRGYLQKHWHVIDNVDNLSDTAGSVTGNGPRIGGATNLLPNRATSIVSDGPSGTPRTAKDTHGPALAVFWYMHACGMV